YSSVGWGVLGFLPEGYLKEEGILSGNYLWPLAAWRQLVGALPGDVAIYIAGVAMLTGALGLRIALRDPKSTQAVLADINRLLLTFLALMSPNYPWYFLMATPFTALTGGAPVWTLTIAAALLQEEVTWDPYVPLLIRKTALYGAFLAACAYTIWRARRAAQQGEAERRSGEGRREGRPGGEVPGGARRRSAPLSGGGRRRARRGGDAPAGLPLSRDDQSLQFAVHDLPAHLRGARAAGRHELGSVRL